MDFSDDFGPDDDDTEFLAAATQIEATQNGVFDASPRPAKRRRIRRGPPQVDGASSHGLEWSESDSQNELPHDQAADVHSKNGGNQDSQFDPDEPESDAAYYFPGEQGGPEEEVVKNSKYKIHVPKNVRVLQDLYLTQTQAGLDDDPTAIRGAVWKKPPRHPPKAPPPLFNTASNGNASRLGQDRPSAVATNGRTTSARGMDAFVQRQATVAPPPSTDDDEAFAMRLQAEEDAQHRQTLGASETNGGSTSKLAIDVTQDLADLPSDAFSSSAGGNSPAKDFIEISSQPDTTQRANAGLRAPQAGLKQMTIFGQAATQPVSASQAAKKKHAWPLKARDEPPTHHGLDPKAMETWVYPTNLGIVRDYQFNIVTRSLFHNTLVALPTGLGKTFIAATIMLNYYRWTKDAQIIFMAPTKPLIAQQMEACYGIAGIQRRDTVLMTGETVPTIREEEWLEKRVFFMTPQTVINDLKKGICDPKKIVLIVVDEAHKATGGYAYTEVVAFLRRFNTSFRVLALTATPGSRVEAVQAVIDNLGIARVELRTEASLDIRQYTHEKHTDTEVFDWSDEQELIMDHVTKAVKPVLDKLNQQNAYWSRDPMQLTAYGLNQARGKWMSSDAGRRAPMGLKGMVNGIFAVLASLAHGFSLLKFHGIAPFLSSAKEFQRNVESGQTKSKYAKQITEHEDWVKAMGYMRSWSNNPDFIGHPKLQYLREVVLNHFLDAGEGGRSGDANHRPTRIMVFASYRDSTQEICRVLKRSEPMIRPHEFVGQASSKGSEGMNQKKQNEVVQDFKAGKYNTLVATSIGEEGLDIGDVDLIVCYDASASPIRMLQRIGRTGRKRVGRVVLLLMRTKEENDYAKAQDNYSYIQKSIADAAKYTYRDEQSPRILPKEVQPAVEKRHIYIPVENTQAVDLNEKGRRRKGKGKAKKIEKRFNMPDGVRTGFVSAGKLGSDDDSEQGPAPKKTTKRAPPTKARKPPPSPEPEPAQLPFLDQVLLTDFQKRELDRKYAHTSDSAGNTIIKAPDPANFPDSLRLLGGTKYVSHSRASKNVAKALQAVRDFDKSRLDRYESIPDHPHLEDTTGIRARLVNPVVDIDPAETEDLPTLPLPRAEAKVKPKPRARKKQPLARTTSYGSAAMEGGSSSPEPTPANMRIGTQGIDLGSADTSGEDEDELPDSELAEFVVGSDQPIEAVSSSMPGTQELTRANKAKRKEIVEVESESENEDDEGMPKASAAGNAAMAESSPIVVPGARARKRRVVLQESEDEEE